MISSLRTVISVLVLSLLPVVHSAAESGAANDRLALQRSQVDDAILATIFSGTESLHYSVSWSGGMNAPSSEGSRMRTGSPLI